MSERNLYNEDVPRDPDLSDELMTDVNTAPVPSGSGMAGQSSSSSSGMDKAQNAASKAQDKAEDVASKAQDKAQDVASKAQDKADEMSSRAQDAADQGMEKASEGLDSAADMLRQKGGPQGSMANDYANTVADKLESAGGYLREKDSSELLNDLEDLVRRKPMESLLAAAGIGLLLSRIVK